MAFKVRASKIEGLKPLLDRLEGLKKATQKSIVRKAVDAASKVVLDAIKLLVPKDTAGSPRRGAWVRKVVVGTSMVRVWPWLSSARGRASR